MIEEIFEVEKIKEDLKTDLVINVSKLDGVHFQSPSLVGIKNLDDREEIFQKLTILFDFEIFEVFINSAFFKSVSIERFIPGKINPPKY